MSTAEILDLSRFCGGDYSVARLSTPFSRGDYTWATDGKIMVRVPRRGDVPEVDGAPAAERVWPDTVPPMVPVRPKAMPAAALSTCEYCDGRGHEHDCPDCRCECETCDGTGRIEELTAVSVGDRMISLKYARLMMALPSLEVDPAPSEFVIRFRFDGGDGIVASLGPHARLRVVADLFNAETADG